MSVRQIPLIIPDFWYCFWSFAGIFAASFTLFLRLSNRCKIKNGSISVADLELESGLVPHQKVKHRKKNVLFAIFLCPWLCGFWPVFAFVSSFLAIYRCLHIAREPDVSPVFINISGIPGYSRVFIVVYNLLTQCFRE